MCYWNKHGTFYAFKCLNNSKAWALRLSVVLVMEARVLHQQTLYSAGLGWRSILMPLMRRMLHTYSRQSTMIEGRGAARDGLIAPCYHLRAQRTPTSSPVWPWGEWTAVWEYRGQDRGEHKFQVSKLEVGTQAGAVSNVREHNLCWELVRPRREKIGHS